MDDLISRQAAIDALHMHLMYRMGTDSNKKRLDDWINGLPSAQETHEERTETHACDLISRQAAIKAICEDGTMLERQGKYTMTMAERKQRDVDILDTLPPAQLAQDLTKGCTDTISRQAAIDALGERPMVWVESDYELGARNQYDADVLALETVPPAQPERKRGKWIEDDDGWDGVIWRCSECDALFTLVDGTPEENEYYFCPHCGADMREVSE